MRVSCFRFAWVCLLLISSVATAQSNKTASGEALPVVNVGAMRGISDDSIPVRRPANYEPTYGSGYVGHNNYGPENLPPAIDPSRGMNRQAAFQESYASPSDDYGPATYESACGWALPVKVYGEFMYLRARDAEVAYGVLANSVNGAVPGATLTEVSRVGVVDLDYSSTFRGGITYAMDCYNSISGQYSYYDNHTQDRLDGNAQNNRIATSLVFDPSTLSAVNQTFLRGEANLGMKYDLIDLDYRNLASCSDTHELTLLAGLRYANLRQSFDATFSDNGTGFAATQIDFEGFGARLGVEAERRFGEKQQFFVTGKGYLGLLAGEFNADYRNGNRFDDIQVQTSWQAGRLVTTTEVELGFGYRTQNDRFRLQVGYVFNSWFNMMKTQEWIHAVQQSNYVDPASNFNGLMTFDGLTGRAEFRF